MIVLTYATPGSGKIAPRALGPTVRALLTASAPRSFGTRYPAHGNRPTRRERPATPASSCDQPTPWRIPSRQAQKSCAPVPQSQGADPTPKGPLFCSPDRSHRPPVISHAGRPTGTSPVPTVRASFIPPADRVRPGLGAPKPVVPDEFAELLASALWLWHLNRELACAY